MPEDANTSEHAIASKEIDIGMLINESPSGEKRKFLKNSIDYMQERLNFVNDKANIFIAIQTGLFVGIVWLLGTFFLPSVQQGLTVDTISVLVFLLINFSFVIAIVALLLQTIRPSEGYLSLFTGIDTIETTGVMWPGSDVPDSSEFVDKVESMSSEDIDTELIGTVYVLQQLVDRTYNSYRRAVLLMKIQVIIVPISFLVIAFQTYL